MCFSKEVHRKYLLSLISKDAVSSPACLGTLFKQINAFMGMYWIVCSWRLISTDPSPEWDLIKSIVHKKLSVDNTVRLDEHNGALRALSIVQLCVLVDFKGSISHTIANQVLEFAESLTTHTPLFVDMRSVYSLLSILRITNRLNDLSSVARKWFIEYVFASQSVLGGFGAGPSSEAHAGFTFCAVASFKMLNVDVPRVDRLIVWAQTRLDQCNGRPGKPRDSCYLWWSAATLTNLHVPIDPQFVTNTLSGAFVHTGGFSKDIRDTRMQQRTCEASHEPQTHVHSPGASQDPQAPGHISETSGPPADLFHTFLALASLALVKGQIDPMSVLPV